VDPQDRYLGILDVSQLADVLKRMRAEAKKHYDDLETVPSSPNGGPPR